MDLMKVTTSYKNLKKKYSGFRAPTIEIAVNGTKLISGKNLHIMDLDMELTADYEASGCSFSITGAYAYEKTDFSGDANKLQLGEPVEISVGYIRMEKIFDGFINQVEYHFGTEEDAFRIRVECMDVKGLMMKRRRLEVFNEKSPGDIVRAICREQPVSSYLKGMEIENADTDSLPLRTNMRTDYDIVTEQAQKHGFEFFVVQGKVYFREKEKNSSPVMEIGPGQGLIHARLSLSGDQLVKTVEVRSIDETNAKVIKGEASLSGRFSASGSAGKMLGNSRQIFYEPGVDSAQEAGKRAAARMDQIQLSFGEIECECIGLPEIGPGRFISVRGLSKTADRDYYICYVRHMIDLDGYHTIFKARMRSL
jgi:phage protein D